MPNTPTIQFLLLLIGFVIASLMLWHSDWLSREGNSKGKSLALGGGVGVFACGIGCLLLLWLSQDALSFNRVTLSLPLLVACWGGTLGKWQRTLQKADDWQPLVLMVGGGMLYCLLQSVLWPLFRPAHSVAVLNFSLGIALLTTALLVIWIRFVYPASPAQVITAAQRDARRVSWTRYLAVLGTVCFVHWVFQTLLHKDMSFLFMLSGIITRWWEKGTVDEPAVKLEPA